MAKRARPNPESAAVVLDMSPWAQEFAEWREQQALREAQELEEQEHPESEMINALEETKGCAILDSGATVMCSSTAAAEEIQVQRLRQHEPGDPTIRESDRCFRFAGGRTDGAQ